MMAYDKQLRCFGPPSEPANKRTVTQVMAAVEPQFNGREKVALAWMRYPSVDCFIDHAATIDNADELREVYIRHIEEMPAMESFARAARATSGTNRPTPRPIDAQAAQPPTWYESYLVSPYWKSFRQRAIVKYGGCVLCGKDTGLQCHHRHYKTMGDEELSDVSILCERHHNMIRQWVSIRVPRSCPPNVRKRINGTS
jgi:hypothetical protein